MRLILKFKSDGKELCLLKKENKYEYGKIESSEITTTVTREEKALILEAFKQILPSQNAIKLKDYKFRGKSLIHLFDKEKGYHLFYEKTPNGLKKPSNDELYKLNNFFNAQSEVVFLGASNNNNNSFFKRVVKKGKAMLVVLVASTLFFALSGDTQTITEFDNIEDVISIEEAQAFIKEEQKKLTQESKTAEKSEETSEKVEKEYTKDNDIEELNTSKQAEDSTANKTSEVSGNPNLEDPTFDPNKDLIQLDDETPLENNSYFDTTSSLDEYFITDGPTTNGEDEDFTVERIINIIRNNPNLSEEDKDLFLSNPQIFVDNLPYYNQDTVIEQQTKLHTTYTPHTDSTAEGCYFPSNSEIVCYGVESQKEAKSYIKTHEYCHSLSDYSNYSYGSAIYEMLNAKFNNEYFGIINNESEISTYDPSYWTLGSYCNALCEIIDAPTLRRYHANPDPKIIADYLSQIINDEEKAYTLISQLDYIKGSSEYNQEYLSEDEKEQLLVEANEIVTSSLKDYYEKKYNESITNNLTMLYALYPSEVEMILDIELLDGAISRNEIGFGRTYIPKTYFNGNNDLILQFDKLKSQEMSYTLDYMLQFYEDESQIPYEKSTDGHYILTQYESIDKLYINLSTISIVNNTEISR